MNTSHLINSDFWKKVLTTYLDSKPILKAEHVDVELYQKQLLWHNNAISYKNSQLSYRAKGGVETVHDIIHLTDKRPLTPK